MRLHAAHALTLQKPTDTISFAAGKNDVKIFTSLYAENIKTAMPYKIF
jgi:hypothetical protein